MNISLIAAVGKNYELGKDGSLIWKIKEDLNFFKNTTINHTVVMGRKTFESLNKPLKDRENVVISKTLKYNDKIKIYRSIKEFLNAYNDFFDEIFIIGGESIYKSFIDISNKIYLTEIDSSCKSADTFFPRFDLQNWEKEESDVLVENGIKYKHVLYKRDYKKI